MSPPLLFRWLFAGLFSAAPFASVILAGSISVDSLRCEYLKNPVGIDAGTPRFTWQLSEPAHTRGQKQTAYQVLIASTPALLEQGRGDIWDSGQVASSQSALVSFAGKALVSNQACYWKVRIWDKDRQPSTWSAPARFSMGLLHNEDWTGPWIRNPRQVKTSTEQVPLESHLWFRKNFDLTKPVASAFIHVASLGYHELYVNGQKADDSVLAPAISRLDKRVLYVTYDIARLLRPGANTIALWTGPGWTRFKDFKVSPSLRIQLNATTTDGQPFALASDSTWRCAVSSSKNIGGYAYKDYGGERLDARKDIPEWNIPGFDDRAWDFASEAPVKVTLSAQMVEPTRIIETIPAQNISLTKDGACSVDLGKNFSGWLELKLHGQAPGDLVVIQVADDAGTVQDFGQREEYICKGGAEETFRNRFNYAAGRYITLTGLKNKPQPTDVTGLVLGTDLERTGRFTCSNPLFNQIYETDLWTYRVNTVEACTSDCPHRERLGYGEENFATAWGIGLPNYRAGALYTKIARDWSDVQEADGWIHHTAPQTNWCYGGTLWSSGGLNIAWEAYQTYGDTRLIAENYPSTKRWLDFLDAHTSNDLLQSYKKVPGMFLGDWAAPGGRKEFGDSPEALYFNNCAYAMNLETAIRMARIVGTPEDIALYQHRLEALKQQVHATFFHPETNTYLKGGQVQQAFALLARITPETLRPAVAAVLEKDMTLRHPYIDAGSSGLPILLKYLIEESGRADLLFAPLSKTNEPSYGYFLARGETTWPEYWNVDVPSRMHTCYTGIASWFTKSLAGIRPDPAHPGGQSVLIQPLIASDTTFAEASSESLYGPIGTRWDRTGEKVVLKVTVPPNSTATVYVPARSAADVTESGKPLDHASGVNFLRMEKNMAVCEIDSGNYLFSSTLP